MPNWLIYLLRMNAIYESTLTLSLLLFSYRFLLNFATRREWGYWLLLHPEGLTFIFGILWLWLFRTFLGGNKRGWGLLLLGGVLSLRNLFWLRVKQCIGHFLGKNLQLSLSSSLLQITIYFYRLPHSFRRFYFSSHLTTVLARWWSSSKVVNFHDIIDNAYISFQVMIHMLR